MAYVQAIARFSDRLVRREQERNGVDAETAVRIVARKVKACAGTLANILRCRNGSNRVKSICFALGQRIVRAALSDIEQEKKRLEEEHAVLMDLGPNADPDLLAAVEASLQAAREGLAKMRAGR